MGGGRDGNTCSLIRCVFCFSFSLCLILSILCLKSRNVIMTHPVLEMVNFLGSVLFLFLFLVLFLFLFLVLFLFWLVCR